jgi:hypothetical protein
MADAPLLLAIDFDDTIMDTKNKLPGYKLGRPVKGAAEAMKKLKSEGAIITIHSVWASTEQKCQAMSKWCRFFDIPYDFITNQKPIATFYLDNNGLRFETWDQALADIKRLRQES